MLSSKTKEVYEPEATFESFYTGGVLEWTEDGKFFLCQCGTSLQLLDVNEGKASFFVGEKLETSGEDDVEDIISTFVLSKKNDKIVTAHRNGLLKLWNYTDRRLVKHWKSVHKGVVVRLAVDSSSEVLASGGSDGSVRLWDMTNNSCLRALVGIQGVCSVLKFYEEASNIKLFAAGDDGTLVCWAVPEGVVVFTCSGHYSPISGIDFSPTGDHIISCGRDGVVILWNMDDGKQNKVIPLYENPQDIVALPATCLSSILPEVHKKGIYFVTAGEKGVVRVFEALTCREMWTSSERVSEGAILHLAYNPATSSLALASFDHNIFLYPLHSLDKVDKQFVGSLDEVLDVLLVGKGESHLALATNSPVIKLYTRLHMNCQFLRGHEGFVLSLAKCPSQPDIFASASKDHSFRVWFLKNDLGHCVAAGMYHNSSVTAISFSINHSFIVTGSEDTILKMWNLPTAFNPDKEPKMLVIKDTCIAHDKELNTIAVAPSNGLIATGSADKTAKLWNADDLSCLGTLRGHRRGVWSVCFSPVDKVCLTSSADTTLKIWSLFDLTCLKTLEGHESSVMKAAFLSRGLQIVSASGDGLLKLWRIGTSECTASFDAHKGKIWALAVSRDESTLVTGCSASRLVIWKDVTEEKKLEEAKKAAERALADQELSNLLQTGQLVQALRLALSLGRPATVLTIIQDTLKSDNIRDQLKNTLSELDDNEKISLLNCAAHWNTNSKFCYAAQHVINLLLLEIGSNQLEVPQTLIEAIIPYTERHYERICSLIQDIHLLDYTALNMKV